MSLDPGAQVYVLAALSAVHADGANASRVAWASGPVELIVSVKKCGRSVRAPTVPSTGAVISV